MQKYLHARFLCYNVNMEDVKKNISENLILLRKSNKLTQQELAKKFNYSDKAVSRWELGDSLPDINVLIKLCEYYNVSFEWLIKKHTDAPTMRAHRSNKTLAIKLYIVFLLAACIFSIPTFYYTYNLVFFDKSSLIVFVWAIPISTFFISFLCLRWWHRLVALAMFSITLWSLILAFVLQFDAKITTWPLFILGIPLQIIIILLSIIKKERL